MPFLGLFVLVSLSLYIMEKEQFKQELSSMEIRLTDMEEKIDSINTKLTQVVDAILGNPLTKSGGFIQEIEILKNEVADLKKKQAKYEEFKKKTMWTVGIIIALGAVIQYGVTIYANLVMAKKNQISPPQQIIKNP